jgi:hypothetical protein
MEKSLNSFEHPKNPTVLTLPDMKIEARRSPKTSVDTAKNRRRLETSNIAPADSTKQQFKKKSVSVSGKTHRVSVTRANNSQHCE